MVLPTDFWELKDRVQSDLDIITRAAVAVDTLRGLNDEDDFKYVYKDWMTMVCLRSPEPCLSSNLHLYGSV